MLRAGIFLGDRYEIIERIGSGGMAEVFRGKDHKLNRAVAIKVMRAEYKEDKEFVSKFRVEAQAAAGLAHPNIVGIFDVGEDNGMYYIVMEIVEGITLKRYIEKKGRLTVRETITIAIQISLGIEAAHDNHIIHRDIKPQNILISKDGKVKVTDFGIAKDATSNTINASVVGSVHYTSPEQAKGLRSTEKSDIYSLGITMYEMLTGHPPYDGEETVSIAVQHIQEAFPSIREEVPDIPVSLERIIEKCTMKKPEMRYVNMADLIRDLKQSLLTPDKDFVEIMTVQRNGKTIRMTPEQIRDMKRQLRDEENLDEPDLPDNPERDEDEDEDEALNPTLRKVLTGLGIVAAVLIVGIAIFAGYSLFKSLGGSSNDNNKAQATASAQPTEKLAEDEVRMINVLGLTYEEAQKKLNNIGLGIDEGEQVSSDKYKKGEIAGQSIAEGTVVKKNDTVYVSISKGEGALTVPADLAGKTNEEAQNALTELELVPEVEMKYDNSVEMGVVISVEPSSGTEVNKGDTVKLIVSRGKQKITVPNLYNKTEEEAKAELEAKGLRVGTVSTSERLSDTVEAGRVLSQNYASGSTVEHGTAVDIVLSKGMEEAIWKGTLKIAKSDMPEDFESGNVKFELIQVVNGEQKTTVVQEGQMSSSDFPYTLQLTGEKSVASGRVLIYINDQKVDGEHSVVFAEE